jgi:hypothetical protein
VRKLHDTYRFIIRDGPKIVHGGITDDLERSKAEGRRRWPGGRFFQVGEKTTDDEAREWATKNGFSA